MTGRRPSLRPLVAELLGTAMLLASVVGSGIVVSSFGDSTSLALFQHAMVVGATLVALILVFGPVSGAHFNPVVTVTLAWTGHVSWRRVGPYVVAQVVGATAGTVVTHLTFGLSAVAIATTPRAGGGMMVGELVATTGLLVVILGLVRTGRTAAVPGAVGAWIAAAIVFTSSDAFANPAVTLARALTDTWTGIAPSSVPGFLAGQALAVVAAAALVAVLFPTSDHPDEPTDHAAHEVSHEPSQENDR